MLCTHWPMALWFVTSKSYLSGYGVCRELEGILSGRVVCQIRFVVRKSQHALHRYCERRAK
jgi:hypothetical protein